MFTLAHLSDLHVTSPLGANPLALLNKRYFGWLSWKLRRGKVHRPEVVEALIDDLHAQAPDHVAVTGDLTNVALEHEFVDAAQWLGRIGAPDRVTLIPGNHDAYVRIDRGRSWNLWADFMRADAEFGGPERCAAFPEFPTLRVRGGVAIVGICSALPTALFRATGRVGSAQLARLRDILTGLAEGNLFRVVLIHHPPTDEHVSARRRLVDSAALCELLGTSGAELVLHGHVHRTAWSEIRGPVGAIPVAGVRSASDVGVAEHKRAQYHLYSFEASRSARIRVRIRGYDVASRAFVAEGERWL